MLGQAETDKSIKTRGKGNKSATQGNKSKKSQIYVDGVQRSCMDTAGDFSSWDDQYQFYLGNEGTMDRPWLGEYHLVAIYRRALTRQEILQNFIATARID